MPPKRALGDDPKPNKATKRQTTARKTHEGGVTQGNLCSQCSKLKIETMLSQETNSKDFGFLGRFMELTCPFCSIIWDCIRLHWGSASPLDNGSRPRLYAQSKKWGSFKVPGDSSVQHRIYRILLAVTEQPPGFRFNRRLLPTDKQNRFIIGEVELLDSTSNGQRSAPRLRRDAGSFFDIDQLRGWLRDCQKHDHNSESAHELFRGGFRLIDVVDARLVEMTEPCDYIALSYVWGNDPCSLRTTKENLERFKDHGALETAAQGSGIRIRRTIVDAMNICIITGHRYLWVDCLCIVQDDETEKQRLIHGMNHVYENASLTIIAASGQDAEAGLAGITDRENQIYEKRYMVHLPNTLLTISKAPMSLEEQVRKSHWNTRAWTLQEESLSTRRLYFTTDEVFFTCPRRLWRESYATEEFEDCVMKTGSPYWGRAVRSGVHVPLVSVLPRGSKGIWDKSMYAATVSNYSRRNLSYSDDIFNAFSGIYQRCTSAQSSPPDMAVVQGLNSASFAISLLWFTAERDPDKISRREIAHEIILASWSWAAWTAPVDFVCERESSFPAPKTETLHVSSYELFPFVDRWSLAFKDNDCIRNFSILELPPTAVSPWNPAQILPKDILAMLSSKPLLQESNDTSGSLNFVAPCITVSLDSRLTVDVKISDGGHLLMLPGISRHYSIIKFDSADHVFTELALILYDGCFVALCLKTEGQISQRVGVAQVSFWESDWKDGLERGLLRIEWRQICLV